MSRTPLALATVALLLVTASGAGALSLSLDGEWRLRSEAKGLNLAATVPGGVYSDLRRNGILTEDIFQRFNDEEYRWVSREDWSYETIFQVSAEALEKQTQQLVFHGVDTVAEILLNGESVKKVDNMFVRHRVDVLGKLKLGNNTLEVRFLSPVRVALERQQEHQVNTSYFVLPTCVPEDYHGECGANHLRKMQASFGWDWGPAFPSMGLWKSVELECYDGILVRDVSFWPKRTAFAWNAVVGVHWEAGRLQSGAALLVLELSQAGRLVHSQTADLTLSGGATEGRQDVSISIPEALVATWWPNGMGEQPLYDLSVSITPFSSKEKHTRTVRVGFRLVQLMQEPIEEGNSSKGLSFYFLVNGKPMFAKGSNWIPLHVLPELGAEPSALRHLMHSAKEANMNMLRVWGGGVYESELFYQLADELGILIWQDMMFACSMYPARESFASSVKTEVQQQYRRLNHHPSIAIWSANNENEAALRGNWYGTSDNFETYRQDYVKLYVNTIRATVRAEQPDVQFLVSSPSNGIQSEKENFVAQNPYSPLYGDDHHYDYTSDGWDASVFVPTRFSSEYGFQSLPSLASLRSVADSKDLAMNSRFSAWRQHHPDGNMEMISQIERHLPLPNDVNSTRAYPTIVYFSQINQAMSTKTETEFLRRFRSHLSSTGEGLTMGALYWQLNDVWQAPSWASIDFSGRWKMLHHFAVDFFEPVLVVPLISTDKSEFTIDVVSDLDTFTELEARIVVQRWDSLQPHFQRYVNAPLAGPGTVRIWAEPLPQLLAEGSKHCSVSGEDCFLLVSLHDGTGSNTSNQIGPVNFVLLNPLKDSQLEPVTFKVLSVSGPTSGSQHQALDFHITFSVTKPAPFVWLEAGKITGRFSRNGFLMAQSSETVHFHTDEDIAPEDLLKALTITAVNGQYQYSYNPDNPNPPNPNGGKSLLCNASVIVLSLIWVVLR